MIRSISFVAVLALAPSALGGDFKGSDSAVHIKHTAPDGHWNAGSGNCIGYDARTNTSTILSVAHVICNDDGSTWTVTHNGKEYAGKFLFGSKVTETKQADGKWNLEIAGPDLALITVNAKLPVARLSDKPAAVGDRVWSYGFPGGRLKNGPYAKTGVVTSLDIWSTADARAGDSGTALFNEEGFIVGVVHARPVDKDEPAGLAVPLETVKDFLKDALKVKAQPKPLPAPKTLPIQPARPHCTPQRP